MIELGGEIYNVIKSGRRISNDTKEKRSVWVQQLQNDWLLWCVVVKSHDENTNEQATGPTKWILADEQAGFRIRILIE